MTILYVAIGLLAIGLIIFIHEAGHFLAAKRVGVRVERFALGFDPPIRGRNLRLFSKTIGETEYVLGLVPFGGYVKLAGEMIPEDGKTPQPDELLAKSVGARALVFAAGALMNFVSAIVFFLVAFSLGVTFSEPVIGDVQPGSPAWKAGLRAGDEVLELDGDPVVDLTEVFVAAALSGSDSELRFQVRRPERAPSSGDVPPGEAKVLEIGVRPEWNPAAGFSVIGILNQVAKSAVLEAPLPGSPAAEAGVAAGDRLVAVELGGQPLPPLTFLEIADRLDDFLLFHPSESVRLELDRDGERRWVALSRREADTPPQRAMFRVGSGGGGPSVRALAPGADASSVLDVGDRLVAVDGEPVGSLDWFSFAQAHAAESLTLRIRDAAGETREQDVGRDRVLAWLAREEVHWGSPLCRVARIVSSSAVATGGLRVGDLVLTVDGQQVFAPEELLAVAAAAEGARVSVTVERPRTIADEASWAPPELVRLELEKVALADETAINWNTFPPLWTVDAQGPAGIAGITPGSRIESLAGEPVRSFADFMSRVAALPPGSEVVTEWLDAYGLPHQATVRVAEKPMAPLGLVFASRQVERSFPILESFQVGMKRSVLVGKQVFMTLRSLIRRDVTPKNLAGPVGITHLLTRVAELGLANLLYWMAIISINLGLLNLMPFPILDGGHLLFLAIEKIKGSPVSIRVQERVTSVAFLLIIGLALYVTWNDIARLVG